MPIPNRREVHISTHTTGKVMYTIWMPKWLPTTVIHAKVLRMPARMRIRVARVDIAMSCRIPFAVLASLENALFDRNGATATRGAGMGGSWSGDSNNCWDYCFGKEEQISTQLVNIIDSQSFDGIDIDYE